MKNINELATAVAKIDTEEKFIFFLGGLYLSAVLAKSKLYFGAFRDFVSQIVPAKEQEKGDFGLYVPALSSVVNALIEAKVVAVEEGKKKAKLHIANRLEAQKRLQAMEDKYGEKFKNFVNSALDLYLEQDAPKGRYSDSASVFAKMGK